MNEKILILVVSSSETFTSILKCQPQYLSKNFKKVYTVSSGVVKYDNSIKHFSVKINRNISILKDILAIYKLINIFLNVKPDIVHSFTPKAGLICAISAWVAGVPVRIHTFTGLLFPTATGWKKQLFKLIDWLILFFTTKHIAEGNGVKQDLECFVASNKKIDVIGHGNIAGVDTKYFSLSSACIAQAQKLRKTHEIPEQDFVFGYIGRLAVDKGIKELINSFEALKDKCSWLVFVGDLDSRDPISADLIKRIDDHPRILKLGYWDDIRIPMAMFNIVTLPSYREGFPNTLLQSHSMKKAIIASNISGCNEIVLDGVNGWLVPPRDTKALTKSMKNSILKREELIKMGIHGRKNVQKYFEQKFVRQEILKYYSESIHVPRR